MYRLFKAICAIFLVTVAASCVLAAPPDSARIAEARKGIDEGNAKWIEAHRASDAKLLASLFTPDGAFLLKGGEILQGRENIEKEMGDYFKKVGPIGMTITTMEVWVVDSTAYEFGKYTRHSLTPGSNAKGTFGKYFEIWRQMPDGSWKILRDCGLPSD